MEQHRIIPSGKVDPVSPLDQEEQLDRFSGLVETSLRDHVHLWTAAVLHLVDPSLEGQTLSARSIALPPLVGCFICEQAWPPKFGSRCPGDPKGDL